MISKLSEREATNKRIERISKRNFKKSEKSCEKRLTFINRLWYDRQADLVKEDGAEL